MAQKIGLRENFKARASESFLEIGPNFEIFNYFLVSVLSEFAMSSFSSGIIAIDL